MAFLNAVPDLFIGSQELNRLIKFLDDDGFRKLLLQNSVNFGIVNNSKRGVFDNFMVTAGTNPGTVRLPDGIAIDADGQLITYFATDNVALVDDSQWYWLSISHQYDKREVGLCSIDAVGNLTFPGGTLTKVLRGLPNLPVTVSFPGASLNTQEYEVVEVLSDTTAVLAGDFQAESNLRLAVMGTFTPGVTPPSDNKYPYQYDSCLLTSTLETTLNTAPLLTAGMQFTIARVKRTGASVVIQDKRLSIYQSKADFSLANLSTSTNPLIGMEQANFDNKLSPKSSNTVRVAWGLRSSNWTIDSSTNKVTILGGLGGRYKSTADFVNGDFDGWRLYTKGGRYSVIRQSSVSALQINLVLDSLDVDDYADLAQELRIVPNAEEVELIFTVPLGQSSLTERRYAFPVNQGYATVPLEVYVAGSCQYILSYRYKQFGTYSAINSIPSDSVGYYVETAFDADGNLTGSARQTISGGMVTLLESPGSYNNTIIPLVTGNDLFGAELLPLDNVANVLDFVVGTRRQNVIVTQDTDLFDSDADTAFNFTVNQYLNFKSTVPASLRPGNSFLVQVLGNYVPGAFNLVITQDYVSSINPGHVLYTLTADDYVLAKNDKLTFRALWVGDTWLITRIVEQQLDDATITLTTLGKLQVSTVPDGSIVTSKLANGAVTNVKIAAQNAWIALTLVNGWVAASGVGAKYRVDTLGRVHISIAVDGTAATSGVVVSTLGPFLPANDQIFVAFVTTTSQLSTTKTFAISSGGSGEIQVIGWAAGDKLQNHEISYWMDAP